MQNNWSIKEKFHPADRWITIAVTERYDVAQNIAHLLQTHRDERYSYTITDYH